MTTLELQCRCCGQPVTLNFETEYEASIARMLRQAAVCERCLNPKRESSVPEIKPLKSWEEIRRESIAGNPQFVGIEGWATFGTKPKYK